MEKKNVILELEDKLYRGSLLSKEDALKLTDADHKNLGTGANAAISGDMLTTSGITVETDITMIKDCGFDI